MAKLPVEVLEYRERGWSLIPMKMEAKRPKVRWKKYQREHASDSTLRRWFTDPQTGIGVVFGGVSDGLASRDFDDMDSYRQWSEENPELARTLPTVATRRGRHVYCLATPESVLEVRRRLGKPPEARGAINLADGELRAGVGCYTVLPPSTHPSGHIYRWEIPLPDGPMPLLDLLESNFVTTQDIENCHPCNTEAHRALKSPQAISEETGGEEVEEEKGRSASSYSYSSSPLLLPPVELEPAIQVAIEATIPTTIGQRHKQVFEFARALKAIPQLVDADPRDLRDAVKHWHQRALPMISTKPFTETWIDFLKGWPNVRYPRGEEPITAIFTHACNRGLPPEADDYDQVKLQLLVGLCRELQRGAGDSPFFLACRTAGDLLEVDHTTASRWLFLLVSDGLLEEVEKGEHAKKRASCYRYMGEL